MSADIGAGDAQLDRSEKVEFLVRDIVTRDASNHGRSVVARQRVDDHLGDKPAECAAKNFLLGDADNGDGDGQRSSPTGGGGGGGDSLVFRVGHRVGRHLVAYSETGLGATWRRRRRRRP